MDFTKIEIDGSKLKTLREIKNLTFKDVGDAVGVGRGTIYNYEQGNAAPSSKVLARLCAFFNVPIEVFTTTENNSKVVSY